MCAEWYADTCTCSVPKSWQKQAHENDGADLASFCLQENNRGSLVEAAVGWKATEVDTLFLTKRPQF